MKSPKGSKMTTTPAASPAGETSRVENLIRNAEKASQSGNEIKARDCLAAIFETLSAYQMNRRPVGLDAESGKAASYQIAHSA